MCGLGKLNAAALDTTVACGYNGIDQHNLGLLPPIAGIDTVQAENSLKGITIAPPSRGLILVGKLFYLLVILLPPIAGIDNPFNLCACYISAIAPHCGD